MSLRALHPHNEIDVTVKDLQHGDELIDGLAVVCLIREPIELVADVASRQMISRFVPGRGAAGGREHAGLDAASERWISLRPGPRIEFRFPARAAGRGRRSPRASRFLGLRFLVAPAAAPRFPFCVKQAKELAQAMLHIT